MKKIGLILGCALLLFSSAFGTGIRKTTEGKIEVMIDDFDESVQAEPKYTGCQFTRGVDSLTLTPHFAYTEDVLTCYMKIEFSGTTSYSKIIFIGDENKMSWEFSSNNQEYDNRVDKIFGGHNPYANKINATILISPKQFLEICEFFENNNPIVAVYNTKNQVEEMKPYGKRAKEYFKAMKEYYENHELDKLLDTSNSSPSQLVLKIK